MDTDSGANGMMVSDMGMNYNGIAAYPDPSNIFPDATTMDFADPGFFYPGPTFFDNEIPVQPYVSPGSLLRMSPSSINFQQPLPATIGTPMAFQSMTPPTSSGSSTRRTSAMEVPYQGTSPSPTTTVPKPKSKSKKKPSAPTDGVSGPKKRGRKAKPPGTPKQEAERRQAFLERNRQAATKCRDKKKQKDSALHEKMQLLKAENTRSKNALSSLCAELEDLVLVAKKHTEGNCCADELQATVQRAASKLEASWKSSLVGFTPPASEGASSSSTGMSPGSMLDLSTIVGGFENEDLKDAMDFSAMDLYDERPGSSE